MPAPHHRTDRARRLFVIAASCSLTLNAWAAESHFVEVWKDGTCTCCNDWVAHLKANGFKVKVNDTGNNAVRKRLGIDMKYATCHTAVVGGYAIEGHVPAREITRILRERPKALGLTTVPRMPMGSPGMDGPAYHGKKDAYQVMLLAADGSASEYQRYEAGKS